MCRAFGPNIGPIPDNHGIPAAEEVVDHNNMRMCQGLLWSITRRNVMVLTE